MGSRRAALVGVGVACAAALAAALAMLATSLPPLKAGDIEILRRFPPQSVQQLMQSRDVLLRYAVSAPSFVLVAFVLLYVSMQSCAIPARW